MEWFKLLGLLEGDFKPPSAWLEGPRSAELNDHGVNFKVCLFLSEAL